MARAPGRWTVAVLAATAALLAACSGAGDTRDRAANPVAAASPTEEPTAEAATRTEARTPTATPAPPEQTGFAEGVGEPLWPFSSGSPDLAIGEFAPAIRAQTFRDEDVTIDPADGTGRVIGFFAHWCPHCQTELAQLSQWLLRNDLPPGVEVVAVSTAYERGVAPLPSDWFEAERWPGLVLRDSADSAIAAAFGLTSFPLFVAVDGSGTVLGRVSGDLDEAEWEALLDLAATGGLSA